MTQTEAETGTLTAVRSWTPERVKQAAIKALSYEEGTFTPVLFGTTVAGANTYQRQLGRYIRVGKLIYYSLIITLSAKDPTMAGGIRIRTLPYPIRNQTDYFATSSMEHSYIAYPMYAMPSNYISTNTSVIYLR